VPIVSAHFRSQRRGSNVKTGPSAKQVFSVGLKSETEERETDPDNKEYAGAA